jgi:hypothetical protein
MPGIAIGIPNGIPSGICALKLLAIGAAVDALLELLAVEAVFVVVVGVGVAVVALLVAGFAGAPNVGI